MKLVIKNTLQKAVSAHQAGNILEAERLYRSILEVEPTHPDANHNLGVLAVSVNKLGIALTLFKTALESNQKIEQFWLSYIDSLIKDQQFESAKLALGQAKILGFDNEKFNSLKVKIVPTPQTKYSNNVSPSQKQLSSLLKYYQTGKYGDAEKLATLITHEFPRHQFSWKILGLVLGQTGRNSEAVNANQTAVVLSPHDAEARSNLGITLDELGRLEEAEASYTQAIALKPDYAEAHSNLGNTLQKLGRLNEAVASYTQAITLKADYAEAHNNLGVALKELGRLDEAEASYTQAIAFNPDHAEAHNNLGITLKELGRLEEAEENYTQAIALKPELAEAHYNLGTTLQNLDKFHAAEAAHMQALALKPNFAEAHCNLGNTLKELGRLDEAEASFTQAIALKSDLAEAHNNLGITLDQLGRLEEAEASFTQAISLNPDYAEAHSNLGIMLAVKGRTESALYHFERNLQLERGVKPINFRHRSFVNISKAKIDHDIEQFEYLADSGYEIKKFRELIDIYKTVASEINSASDTDIVPLSDKHQRLLGDTYNRPIHMLEAPLLDEPTINKSLDINKTTDDYFSHEFGLTYIDDLLNPMTLSSLRNFLLRSTIWFDFFHPGGYMGAYLKDGLASPLILQIAEDLRKKFPKIFKYHKLTQLWAYKYDSRARDKNSFSGINAHADFAAINVNFWITPKSANLDPSSGGLVVYNTEAPLEWDFKTFNNNDEKIRKEIIKHEKNKNIIPYNENRAVIFNSNLFHETDNINFKDGYENRRINVTMLFGKREL